MVLGELVVIEFCRDRGRHRRGVGDSDGSVSRALVGQIAERATSHKATAPALGGRRPLIVALAKLIRMAVGGLAVECLPVSCATRIQRL
jgi:hypothetical protein